MSKPWNNASRPAGLAEAFSKGSLMHVFSNQHGEDWVAYIDLDTCDVWVGSVETDWQWYRLEPGNAAQLPNFILSREEQQWLLLVLCQAYDLRVQRVAA